MGPLDLVLLKYAIEVCGGPGAFDGLAITWFDQIQVNGEWHLCERYQNASDQNFFTPDGVIKVRRGENAEQLQYQENLGRQLQGCIPEITTHKVKSNERREELYSLCGSVLKDRLGVSVRMVSFGPTELDKVCK